jgi:hypothetical protein
VAVAVGAVVEGLTVAAVVVVADGLLPQPMEVMVTNTSKMVKNKAGIFRSMVSFLYVYGMNSREVVIPARFFS